MDLKQITIYEEELLYYHLQESYEIWCNDENCCSQHGGRFFGKPLYLMYGKEDLDVNLLCCKQCWIHNFRKIQNILAEIEAADRELEGIGAAEFAKAVEEVEIAKAVEEVEVAKIMEESAVELDISGARVEAEAEAEADPEAEAEVEAEADPERIPILSISEARERYSNIEKDCFVINCNDNGNVKARCFWCKKYSDGLLVYKTNIDNDFYIVVAGHEYNCIS